MRMTRRGGFRAATLLAAVAAGTLTWTGTAAAVGRSGVARSSGVTITTSPAPVHQGDAVEVAVEVPEDLPGSTTNRIELRMPVDAPIGEVYPLSVPGWAPRITTRTLDRPVAGIHAPELDQVTEAVTWIRVPDAATGPARLLLAMGPMPATERLTFQVVQTYADGTVVRWADPPGGAHPAPTVPLLPALPGAGGHGGHGSVAEAPAGVAAPAPADGADGPDADLLLGGGLLVGLAGGGLLGWLLSRRRHCALALPDQYDEAEKDGPDPARDDPDPADEPPHRGDRAEPVLSVRGGTPTAAH